MDQQVGQLNKTMNHQESIHLEPSGAVAFVLEKGHELTVIDPIGKQVADLVSFRADNIRESLSSGRTLDYTGTLRITEGHSLYSNRSNTMLNIVSDAVGRHDFLFAACSQEMFARQYGISSHPNCLDVLAGVLSEYGITVDDIPTPFNIFMNVEIDSDSGALIILEPLSVAGSRIVFRAQMDLIVAISACSAERTNANNLGPIELKVSKGNGVH